MLINVIIEIERDMCNKILLFIPTLPTFFKKVIRVVGSKEIILNLRFEAFIFVFSQMIFNM